MIKIEFKNGSIGKTPINATNLNQMQDNMKDATMINKISLQGNSVQEGTPSVNSEVPIKSAGDNIQLFDVNEPNGVYSNQATFEKITNGIRIKNKIQTTGSTFSLFKIMDVSQMVGQNITCKAKWNANAENNGQMILGLCDENGDNRLAKVYISTSEKEKTFIIPEITTSKYLALWLYGNVSSNANVGDYVDYTDIKICKGTLTGAYSPYGQGSIGVTIGNETTSQTQALYTQQPLRAIGDVKDRFIRIAGVWYEEHNTLRYIFNGNESDVSLSGTYNGVNVFQILEPFNYKLEYSEVDNAKSNYFECQKTLSYISASTVVAGIQLYYNQKNTSRALYINTDKFTTVEELKSWLSEQYTNGTPLYVDYILAIPTLIECTPEQVETLNDIYSAYGSGLTNITCTDEVVPVIEIVKETKEAVQSENDKAISSLLARIEELEKLVSQTQSVTSEEGA